MPVLYFGLVAALAWLGYSYYTDWAPREGHAVLLALAWLTPGFILSVLVLFLLKPLFAPRAKAPEAVKLSPDDEPALVAAVHSLCQAIGVRPPRGIYLSHSVNAWVQFAPGLSGIVGGARTLTIGLPLAAGMTSRQLVGVLAHEFGHFAQRGGMRAAHVINYVNRWLESRAYHPDEWDARLRRWIEGDEDDEGGDLFQLVCAATLASLQATRLLLRAMFQLSFRMSRRLSQEMEFDADRYEVAIAGSDSFATTALRLRALAQALHEVEQANIKAWREGRLVNDLAAAAVLRLGQWRKEDWQAIELQLDNDDETRYWDSHPADQARIANAMSTQVAGMFVDERPATELFADFSALSMRVTAHYYRGMALAVGTQGLITPAQLLGMGQLPDELAASWKRFGNDMLGAPPLIDPAEAGLLPTSGFDWQGSIDELRRLGPDSAGLWQRLQRLRMRADEAALWVRLVDMDASFVMPDGSEPDPAALRAGLAACLDEQSPDRKLATRIGALFARRLHLGMATLEDPDRSMAERRWELLGHLHGAWPKLQHLVSEGSVCLRLITGMSGDAEHLRPRAYALGERHRQDLVALLEVLDSIPLPDGTMLGRHLRARCGRLSSAGDDPFQFIRVTAPVEDAFLELYQRELAELARAVETAERAHDIRPIR
ncbi:MAG: M48 family metallopeptidase, partial [Luteimonas sp.]